MLGIQFLVDARALSASDSIRVSRIIRINARVVLPKHQLGCESLLQIFFQVLLRDSLQLAYELQIVARVGFFAAFYVFRVIIELILDNHSH